MKQVRISHYHNVQGKIVYVVDADDIGTLAGDIVDTLANLNYNIASDEEAFVHIVDLLEEKFLTEYSNYN